VNLEDAAKLVGGTTKDGHIIVRGVTLAFVPGGTVTLGWDGAKTALDAARRAAWTAEADTDETFEQLLRTYLGPRRTVTVAPFLIETTTQPAMDHVLDEDDDDMEAHVRSALASDGWRLPTNDEWEAAARAGSDTLFGWGDEWPDGAPWGNETKWNRHREPNALGLRFGDNPYQPEIVDEVEWLRHGDGGSALCGGRPAPEAWYTFAHAFQYPRTLWEDVVVETYEEARIRRALSL
jgi:hypothetical protein